MGSCLSVDQGKVGSLFSSSSLSSSRRLKNRLSRRFRSCGSSSFNSQRDEWLQGIPGRMFANGSSDAASLFTKQGKKGINQDSMLVWEDFGLKEDTIFCGIFDGHGPFGHLVSRKVRDSLPLKLNAHWDMIAGNDDTRENTMNILMRMNSDESLCLDDDDSSDSSDSNEREQNHPEIFKILKQSFRKAFKSMDKELKVHPSIDCYCSGTTAVTLVKQGEDLIMGNIGDSRAILGTRDENGCLNAVQLTVDLKPGLSREAERIKRCNGRVFALQDEPDVTRVWVPNNDYPGLAMARAFGDFCLKDYGLISIPVLSYSRLTERDEFIVLATDGIWDVLPNDKVVDIVASSPTQSSAARCVVELALRVWRVKYPTSRIDDCAVICLFLNANSPNVVSATSSLENEDSETLNDVIMEDSNATKNPTADQWSALQGMSRANTLVTLPKLEIPPR